MARRVPLLVDLDYHRTVSIDMVAPVQELREHPAQDRQGRCDGFDLAGRYGERGPVYVLGMVRRLRLVDSATLAEPVDDGQDAGRLSQREAESLLVSDAAFHGQLRDDHSPVHLVVEVSVTVARHEVRRARDRADLLARIVGTPVLACVAGDHVPEPAAQDADVWCAPEDRSCCSKTTSTRPPERVPPALALRG